MEPARDLGLRPVAATRAPEQVARQIREMITAGQLAPGDRLPAERDLARTLEVGRTTLREAIRQMEATGILEIRPGSGTYVATDEAPLTILSRPFQAPAGIVAILEVRLLIEPSAAALAAQRATPTDLATLRQILGRQAEQVQAGFPGTDTDLGFHAALFQSAGNAILTQLSTCMHEVLRESRRAVSRPAERRQASLQEHQAILAAVEAHEAGLAHQRMAEHLRSIRTAVSALQARVRGPARDRVRSVPTRTESAGAPRVATG